MYLLLFNKKEKIRPFFCSSLFGCLLYAGELWLAIVIVTVNWWQSALSCSVGLPLVGGGGWGQPLWTGRGTGQNKVGYIIRIKSILLHTKVKQTRKCAPFLLLIHPPWTWSLPASIHWFSFLLFFLLLSSCLQNACHRGFLHRSKMLFPDPDLIVWRNPNHAFCSVIWSFFLSLIRMISSS